MPVATTQVQAITVAHAAASQDRVGRRCVRAELEELLKRVDVFVLNETEAKERNIAYELTTYGIDDLDRAIADESAQGLVKVLTAPGKDKILGAAIVGVDGVENLLDATPIQVTRGLQDRLGDLLLGEGNLQQVDVGGLEQPPDVLRKTEDRRAPVIRAVAANALEDTESVVEGMGQDVDVRIAGLAARQRQLLALGRAAADEHRVITLVEQGLAAAQPEQLFQAHHLGPDEAIRHVAVDLARGPGGGEQRQTRGGGGFACSGGFASPPGGGNSLTMVSRTCSIPSPCLAET